MKKGGIQDSYQWTALTPIQKRLEMPCSSDDRLAKPNEPRISRITRIESQELRCWRISHQSSVLIRGIRGDFSLSSPFGSTVSSYADSLFMTFMYFMVEFFDPIPYRRVSAAVTIPVVSVLRFDQHRRSAPQFRLYPMARKSVCLTRSASYSPGQEVRYGSRLDTDHNQRHRRYAAPLPDDIVDFALIIRNAGAHPGLKRFDRQDFDAHVNMVADVERQMLDKQIDTCTSIDDYATSLLNTDGRSTAIGLNRQRGTNSFHCRPSENGQVPSITLGNGCHDEGFARPKGYVFDDSDRSAMAISESHRQDGAGTQAAEALRNDEF